MSSCRATNAKSFDATSAHEIVEWEFDDLLYVEGNS